MVPGRTSQQQECWAPPTPPFSAARRAISSSPATNQLPASHPSRQTWVASPATRGLSERLVHKCQSRFLFPGSALFSRHHSSLCLHCKAPRGNFSPSTCQIADGSVHGCDRRVDFRRAVVLQLTFCWLLTPPCIPAFNWIVWVSCFACRCLVRWM